MSLKATIIGEIPGETERIAKAAFPKGNLYMKMRDEFGTFLNISIQLKNYRKKFSGMGTDQNISRLEH